MKKIVLLTLTLILFSTISTFAQNNGFIGKRVLFNLDCKASPVFESPTYFGSTESLSADFTFSPGLEVIVHKRGSIGVSFNYLNTQFEHYNEDSYWYIPLNLQLKVYGGSIFYKQYLNKKSDFYQAPFGVFMSFKLDYFQYYTLYHNNSISDRLLGFRTEVGVDYLLWNRVRVSWGLSLGFTNTIFGYNLFDFSGNNSELDDAAKLRVSTNYIFHNRVGIGILLF